jgi:ParB/RepB/Spo0J family partition protein
VEERPAARAIKPKEVKTISILELLKGYRYRTDLGDIESLKQSIQTNGLWHPIVVKETDNITQPYQLLAGGRRLEACRQLGWSEVKASIYPSDLTELESRAIELFENIDRKDMEYAEQVALTNRIHKIMQEIHGPKGSAPQSEGHSMRDTAKMLGKSAATVSLDIELAEAIEVIPELAEAGTKAEAMKMLKTLKKTYEAKELAKAVEKERADTPDKILHKQIMNSYIIGDFFEKIKDVPDNSMDLIELDPDWGAIDLESRPVEHEALHKMKVGGYTKAEGDYLEYLDKVLGECVRVLSETGWIILWFAYHPLGNEIWKLCEKYKLKGPGTPCVWVKPAGQVRAAETNLVRCYELFYYMRKPSARLAREGTHDIFSFRTVAPESRIHITEKPIELMCAIYDTFVKPGSRILIPFLGSGNGILAAYNVNCTAFGFEMNKDIKDKFTLRVNANLPPNYSSYSRRV